MYKCIRTACSIRIFHRTYCSEKKSHQFPKVVFSAIQPSGEVHLGNYLGAITKWVQLQNENERVIYKIADLHSLTLPQDPNILRENIFLMAATLLSCGIDPNKCLLFQQSSVHQHAELCWIFSTLTTMPRLSHLPQFKEKTATLKDIPVGIFMYPVLQSADIALYKATHVPIGKDQIQHIELVNHLVKSFNRNFGETFPRVTEVIDEYGCSIKSLTEPDKKMSKSGLAKSRISLGDSPDEIVQKCKRALTDLNSAVTYDPDNRPGVSNLIIIHSLLTDKKIEDICKESENLNTGKYKLMVADVIVESLKPIREKIEHYMRSRDYLEEVLLFGADKASDIAESTMKEVRAKIGIDVAAGKRRSHVKKIKVANDI